MKDMDPIESIGNLILLIVGGNDTTRNSMSAYAWGLSQFPEERAKLEANQALIPNARQEIIRWQTPLAYMRRTVTQDTEIDGVLGVYSQADWETMRDDEMRARNPVPQQVTMRQARLALLSAGLLDDVEMVVAAAGRAAQLEWEYAAVVERSNPAVAAVQQQESLTDAQIDDLFREAAKL